MFVSDVALVPYLTYTLVDAPFVLTSALIVTLVDVILDALKLLTVGAITGLVTTILLIVFVSSQPSFTVAVYVPAVVINILLD